MLPVIVRPAPEPLPNARLQREIFRKSLDKFPHLHIIVNEGTPSRFGGFQRKKYVSLIDVSEGYASLSF